MFYHLFSLTSIILHPLFLFFLQRDFKLMISLRLKEHFQIPFLTQHVPLLCGPRRFPLD